MFFGKYIKFKSEMITEIAMSLASYRKQLSRTKLETRHDEQHAMYLNGRIDSLLSLVEEMKIQDEVEKEAMIYTSRLNNAGW